jgi:putative membrane protein
LKRFLGELAFAAGLAASIWLVLHLGLRPVGHALATIGVGGVILVSLAHLPTLGVLGLSWWRLAPEGAAAHPAKFVWGRLMRDAGGELLPFSQIGGFALGARALALTGVSGLEATVSSLLDVVVEQAAKAPYAMAAVALLIWLVPGSALVGPSLAVLGLNLAVIVLALARRRWTRERLLKMAAGLDRRWPGVGASESGGAEAAMARALASPGRIGMSLMLHLVGWTLGAGEAWITLRLLGAPTSFAQAVVIDGLFVAFRMFAFAIPAAIGVQEGAYVVLCGLFGIGAPTALAFSLVRRARDLAVGAPAVLAWQLLERGRRASRRAAAS